MRESECAQPTRWSNADQFILKCSKRFTTSSASFLMHQGSSSIINHMLKSVLASSQLQLTWHKIEILRGKQYGYERVKNCLCTSTPYRYLYSIHTHVSHDSCITYQNLNRYRHSLGCLTRWCSVWGGFCRTVSNRPDSWSWCRTLWKSWDPRDWRGKGNTRRAVGRRCSSSRPRVPSCCSHTSTSQPPLCSRSTSTSERGSLATGSSLRGYWLWTNEHTHTWT